MKKFILIIALALSTSAHSQEIIYHVFQRSFFDSNGDGHGDLKGIQQKLDYLQDLGVTSILMTPLYQSEWYHNYFAKDFEKIDEEYGTLDEYLSLVKEVHRRKMKIYQDVEMQYVSQEHPWYTESIGNPSSKYTRYLYYFDSENQKPFYFYNIPEFTMYNNEKKKIIVVNMKDPVIQQYTFSVLRFWVDPNKDGKFDDGVDGFRLDHMMDDLDNQKILTNLFEKFWVPVLGDLKKVNPALIITAEQANWGSLGHEYFKRANVDRVFAFRTCWAIETFNKKNIIDAADSTLLYNPQGKQQIVFLENHDTRRFASSKNITAGKLKAAASLNLLLGGVPLIYYGQELGMKGDRMKGATDGNDIPMREAFEWYASANGNGMAFWYKNTGPWWDSTRVKANDGISLEEEKKDPQSLWSHYKKIIALKKSSSALASGEYRNLKNDNDSVVSFLRYSGMEVALVIVNLSAQKQHVQITVPSERKFKTAASLLSKKSTSLSGDVMGTDVDAYDVQVYRLR